MFSAHDSQIAIIWEFLNAANFNLTTVPYSSFVQMELYKKGFNCKKEDCFFIKFVSNGHALTFDIPSCKDKAMCEYKAMREYLQKISF